MSSLLVTHTSHFVRGPEGAVFSRSPAVNQTFWSRYLTVFDRVIVAARVAVGAATSDALSRADTDHVEFHDLPDYHGPWDYWRHKFELISGLRFAVEQADAVCLRVPCPIATLLWRELMRRNQRFALEVVGDPADALSPGSVRYFVRPLARLLAVRDLTRQCQTASAVSYVTTGRLQQLYRPHQDAYTAAIAGVDLPLEAFVASARLFHGPPRKLILVGTLATLYKGVDVLLRALASVDIPDVRLTIVGDGRFRGKLEQLARDLGLADRVVFRGQVAAGEGVRAELDAADLFVLPSRAEGVPRAMIEALARGLPCIGTAVGGIPELLPPEDLVPPGDADALTRKIEEFLSNPARTAEASRRNLEHAKQYGAAVLGERRRLFYSEVRRRCCPSFAASTLQTIPGG